jgi:hypothetical protein
MCKSDVALLILAAGMGFHAARRENCATARRHFED